MKLKNTIKLSQNLRMSQQLHQAIKMLHLTRQELSQEINKELLENPVLEEVVESKETREIPASSEQDNTPESTAQDESNIDWETYYNFSSKLPQGSKGNILGNQNDIAYYESILSQPRSLSDHLVWQLNLSVFNEKENEIGKLIIDSIDDTGYLKISCEELAENSKFKLKSIQKVLKSIQTFDPVGVGARSLKECLKLQAQILDNEFKDDILDIIENHLHILEKKDFFSLGNKIKKSETEAMELSHIILSMDPRPGLAYFSEAPEYVSPDVYVYKIGEGYAVVLNEEGFPRLRISEHYKDLMKNEELQGSEEGGDAKKYLESKLRSALWMIRSVNQRNKNIYRVAESLLKYQRDFFDKGPEHIKPLILKTIAQDLEVHESTVSRITSNKYIETHHGLFPLKHFFGSGVQKQDGSSFATQAIKMILKEPVENEERKNPLSDQRLVEALRKEIGVDIARRTVAKYREALKILPASKRKKVG